ncbi:MAG TPA: hypothetical protein DEA96_19430 [Leptospiraceae bacterium]|nr:hypothetical protein [Spirochaetaceae bacterium]HBS07154.1 hypothetical protein [Leptospiraceae bacterium]|tara:strand:- start:47489 stop:48148 length:660 start_codon:yes stop_codon:yes gene_type:complete
MRKSILVLIILFLTFACDTQKSNPGTETDSMDRSELETDSTDAPDSTTLHIQSIRNLYAEAMKVPKTSFEKNCGDGALVSIVDVREKDGKLLWIRHTGGYDHGSVSHEVLLSGSEVVFVMKEERTWNFDPDHPPTDTGESQTIDEAKQNRYYFMDGELIRALFKSVVARSVKGESLEKKLQAAPNKAHPTPDAGQALEKAKSIVSGYRGSGRNAYWCSY